MKIMVEDVVTTVCAGSIAVAEDDRYQKLKLFGKTPAMEDVVAEDVVHIIALNLEEDIIDS